MLFEMKRKLAQILFLFLVLAITAILVVQNGMRGEDIILQNEPAPGIQDSQSFQSPGQQATVSAKATATYGAEQFYLQLTAIAGDN
ncbi:MAG: hypothetical protein A2Z16_07600 [Chloroflexi bacterium RBG_16_54_18]|nr:MAG: hypothetical protein A2Z16_07600 [Chloroflexi bacterium RBG_16_54_18]OGO59776.1 MAG: hypothetical protein A2029_12115 [Chloroflexi bacterium RBG_19FT_COMBO_47_9]